MTSGVRFWLIHLAAASVLTWPAGGRANGGRDHDHDRARQALEAGEVLPLRAIIERVERSYPGQVLEVELERDGGRWIYEIKTLRSGGMLVKLKVDARDGSILAARERAASGPHEPGRRAGGH